MPFKLAAIRALIATTVLSLAACADQPRIGDTSRPLMPPGHGLVATTVVFSNPTQPSFMKPNAFIFYFEYQATDGSTNEMWINANDSSVFTSKSPRAKEDDTPPTLVLTPVKPGKYRLKRANIIEQGHFSLWPRNTPEIEVVAGEVTYIGSMLMTYECSYRGIGVRTPVYFSMNAINDFERDMAELKSLDKRLESLVTRNAVAK